MSIERALAVALVQLAAPDDAVQPTLVPEVRKVGTEGAKPPGRELEGVRRRKSNWRHEGQA